MIYDNILSKNNLKYIHEINLSLASVSQEDQFDKIFESLKLLFPFSKATLIHLTGINANNAASKDECAIKLVSKDISEMKRSELTQSNYLLTNNDFSHALHKKKPFWLKHPQQCNFDLLGKQNLVAAMQSHDHSESSLLLLDFIEDEVSDIFLDLIQLILPSLHEAIKRKPANISTALTQREYEVLNWLKEGKSIRVISQLLAISERTVKFHINNICQKLGASNRSHALAKAFRYNLIF